MENKITQKNTATDWKVVPLESLSNKISDGIHTTPKYSDNGDYYFINGNNLYDSKVNFTSDNKRVNYSEYLKHRKDLDKKNTILLSINGTIGTVAYYNDEQVVLGKSCAYITLNSNVNRSFIFYFLNSYNTKKYFISELTGSTIQNLSLKSIKSSPVKLPPLPEQNRIVAVLETWDQAIDKLKRKIEVKKEIKKGLMQELLTGEIRLAGFTGNWSIHNLGELGKIISGGTPETINPNYWGNDYIWITPTEITKLKSRYILDSDKRISTLGLKNSSATLVPPQSLILCSRATIAECAINTVEVTTNQGFKNFVPKKIDIHFFYYWVKLNKKAFLRISAGSTFLEFGKGDMEKLRIEIPNMKEQKAISEILTKADDEIERLKQKLLIFRDQKRYLLNNLVTGTIRTPETLSIPK